MHTLRLLRSFRLKPQLRSVTTRSNDSGELLRAISSLKLLGIELKSFPNVTVIGPQSSGKSSVIEAICGKSILPKAMKMSTMKPVHITLVTCKPEHSEIIVGTRKFKTEQDAAEEIQRLNNNDYIQIITVEVHAPDVYNCSLVDLPGLFVVSTDEHADLPKKIKQLSVKYLEDPNTIPVVVHSAPSDAATNQAIQLVKKCGKVGSTFMVITKVDQAHIGRRTDSHIAKMLSRQEYELGYGSVAVTLRSDEDIAEGKTIQKKIDEETTYFKKSGLAPSGVPKMRQMISDIQYEKIKKQIPGLLQDINLAIENTRSSKSFIDDLVGNDQSRLASQLRIMIEKLVGSSSERALFEDKLKDEFKKIIGKHILELIHEEKLHVVSGEYKNKMSTNHVDYHSLMTFNSNSVKPDSYRTDSIKDLFSYGLLSPVFVDNPTIQTAFDNEAHLAMSLPLIELYTNDPLGKNRTESNKMLNKCFSKLLQNNTIHKMVRDITEQQLLKYIQEDTDNCNELTQKFAEFMITAISDEAYETKINYSITAMLNIEKRPLISLFEVLRYIGQMHPEYFTSKGEGFVGSFLNSKPKLRIQIYGKEWNLAYLRVVGDKLTENCYRNVAVNLLDQMVTKFLELCFDMFNKANIEKQGKKIDEKINELEKIKRIILSIHNVESSICDTRKE